ncbi:MAG: hypothetical protein IPM14_04135 [bacterium]|nr:hypothetical protein [bacterium]
MGGNKNHSSFIVYLFTLILTTASALLYYFMYRLPLLGIDDANIYFKYMRNVADGLGFIYNPGGERVEGFTSVLYTLIGSTIFLFTDKIELSLFIINIIAVSYTIYKVSLFIYNLNFKKYNLYGIIFTLTTLLLVMPGYFFWTTLSLLESGIWSMLICLTTLAVFDENTLINRMKFILLITLLIVTRPEAYFWAFYLIFLKGLFNYIYHKYSLNKVFKENRLFLFTFILVLASLLIWRYNYFGYLLPNTYYVKVYGSFWYNFKLGIEDLFSFLIYTNPILMLTLITIASIAKIKFRNISYEEIVQLILSLIILVAFAIPVVLGGDYFKWNRFQIVFLPVIYVPLFNLSFIDKYILNLVSLKEIIKAKKYLIYSLLFCYIILLPRESLDQLLRGQNLKNSEYIRISEEGQRLAILFNDFFADSELPYISVTAAGMAYKYKGKTLDLLGLNSTKMAHSEHQIRGFKNHEGFNKNVFFDERPDFIYEGFPAKIVKDTNEIVVDINNDIFKSRFINKALDEIWFDKQFQEIYKPVIISKKGKDKKIFTWAGVHYLQKLDIEKYYIKYIHY